MDPTPPSSCRKIWNPNPDDFRLPISPLPPYLSAVRNLFSLFLALVILLSSALFGCFYINVSSETKFERTDKEDLPAEQR